MGKKNLKGLEQLAHYAGISVIFSFLGFGLMFLFKLFAARYFGSHDFGVFSLLETITSLVLMIGGLGLYNGIPRFVAYYKEKKQYGLLKGYLTFATFISFVSGLIISILLYTFSFQLTSFFGFPVEFSQYLQYLSIIIPLVLVGNVFEKYLVGEKKIVHQRISTEGIQKGMFLIGIFIIMLFKLDIIYLVLFYLAGKLLPFVYRAIIFKKLFNFSKKVESRFLKKEWMLFSLPLLFTGLLSLVIRWTDNLVVGKVMEPQNLGVYSVVFSFATLLLFFQRAFTPIFIPLISEQYAKKNHNEISFLFRKSASWVFGLSFPIALLMVVYGKDLLKLIYGNEYVVGFIPLLILAIGLIINTACGFGNQIILLHKKTKYLFYVNLFVSVANVGLNLLLVPILGIKGAAISSAFSMASQKIIFLLIARRYERLSFDYIYYLKFIAAGVPAAFIAALFFRLSIAVWLAAGISVIVYGGLYLLLLLLMRTFTKEDFHIILLIEKKVGLDLKFIKKIVMKFYKT